MQNNIPRPSAIEVDKYLKSWSELEKYYLQEDALNKLFTKLCPGNDDLSDILLKVATLNDFYSTNIFSIYPVAKQILSLQIDKRLNANDTTLVSEIAKVMINGKTKNFYSFATKYCSHHNPNGYPIYDSYIDAVLWHFRKTDEFTDFKRPELKDYSTFKKVLIDFREYYKLHKYTLKQIDQYLWQLGKEHFTKNYGKKKSNTVL